MHFVPLDKSLPPLDTAFLSMQERALTRWLPQWSQSSLLLIPSHFGQTSTWVIIPEALICPFGFYHSGIGLSWAANLFSPIVVLLHLCFIPPSLGIAVSLLGSSTAKNTQILTFQLTSSKEPSLACGTRTETTSSLCPLSIVSFTYTVKYFY